ncbi:bacterio-opsin activator domain-containing protein [Haloarchaeobius sp. DFWS5]|uniref:bacterio-opsin activator domain-containing protein n=1 Tax=Haloarchaeobius sp. DFWS5 TaxID=3446114 RepID=UPI003EBD436E
MLTDFSLVYLTERCDGLTDESDGTPVETELRVPSVQTVSDISTYEQIVESTDVDAVVTTVVYDEMGQNVVAALRDRTPDVPVIAYLESTDSATVEAALEAGATTVVDRSGDHAETLLQHALARVQEEQTEDGDGEWDPTHFTDDAASGVGHDETTLDQDALQTAQVGIAVVDASGEPLFANEFLETLTGVSQSELTQDTLQFEHAEPDSEAIADGGALTHESLPFARIFETAEPVHGVTLGMTRPDGDHRWLSVSGRLLAEEESDRAVFTFEDITDRTERARRLEALNRRSQELSTAKTAEDVGELVVETVDELLGFSSAYVATYDAVDGSLERLTGTDPETPPGDSVLLTAEVDSPVWEAYVQGEPTIVSDLTAVDEDAPVASVFVVPLGTHGVFVAVEETVGVFDDCDYTLVDMLCATATAALDRVDRESSLRVQHEQLEAKERQLDRINRLNHVLRGVVRAALYENSREDIEATVCETLVDTGSFAFVWAGRCDGTTGDLVPAASAGDGRGLLDVIRGDDGETNDRAALEANETGERQVYNSLVDSDTDGPWRQQSLQRGFRSSASVPLHHQGIDYGTLTLYDDTPDVFDDVTVAVLDEVGSLVAFALSALERKEALVSEQSVALDFRISDLGEPHVGFIPPGYGRLELQNVVQRQDGRYHVFLTVSAEDDDDALCTSIRETDPVDEVHVVSADDETTLVEVTLSEATVVTTLVERGARIEHLVLTDDEATLRLRMARNADLRAVSRLLDDEFGTTELRGREERDEPVLTRETFENDILTELTPRQVEVIETAYNSGFFEWPRQSSGEDVADILDVSQPTVTRHIRAGERTVFEALFGGDEN